MSNSSPATPNASDMLPAVLVSLKSDPSRHRMFRPGQPLTAEGVLPNQMLLILDGQARLLTCSFCVLETASSRSPRAVLSLRNATAGLPPGGRRAPHAVMRLDP